MYTGRENYSIQNVSMYNGLSVGGRNKEQRSEEHTSELQSLSC